MKKEGYIPIHVCLTDIHTSQNAEKKRKLSFPPWTLASLGHPEKIKRFSGAPVYIIHMARVESRRRLESEGGNGGGTEESNGANDAVGRGSTLDRLLGSRLLGLLDLGLLRLRLLGGLLNVGASEGGRVGGDGRLGGESGAVGGGGDLAVISPGGLGAGAVDLEGERVLEDARVGLEVDPEPVGLVVAKSGGNGPDVLAVRVGDTGLKFRVSRVRTVRRGEACCIWQTSLAMGTLTDNGLLAGDEGLRGGTGEEVDRDGLIVVLGGGSLPDNGERVASGNNLTLLGLVDGVETGNLGKGARDEGHEGRGGDGELHLEGYTKNPLGRRRITSEWSL